MYPIGTSENIKLDLKFKSEIVKNEIDLESSQNNANGNFTELDTNENMPERGIPSLDGCSM